MDREEKFIVINKKHIYAAPEKVAANFWYALKALSEHLPDNKYWVCNQDEPYADKVISVIADGEDAKALTAGKGE